MMSKITGVYKSYVNFKQNLIWTRLRIMNLSRADKIQIEMLHNFASFE